ncbi:extracellular solute-binding protein [Paenibacillus filicis]|uniref:Extracellular solute-binding protein n=1 Tax=Paenibacillus gyeongsangnamensis TaxID=3388067 RepID=A0ABT4Q4V6_9BACL|nr:extracellular solute-binding protein [Paenibacillus filicis]MCZ8511901.1 extracellular solute-binding protein [Paenibacillus filicis]
MRTYANRSTALAGLLLLASLASGCSSIGVKDDAKANSGAANADAKGNNSIKLRVMWWGSQARHDATLKILDLYTKKNPNITFETEYSGYDGYLDKLTTEAAARNAPDIIQMDAPWLADWNGRSQLADLSSGINTKDVDTNLLETGKYKGKLTAVPLGNNAWGMIYDKSALEKLGVSGPKDGWTWDDYFKILEELKAKMGKGQYPAKDGTNDGTMYSAYQLSKGKGWPITQDGKFNYDRDTWLEWTKKFADLRKKGVVPPPDVQLADKDLDPTQDMLLNNQLIFKGLHAAQVSAYDSLKPNSIGVTAVPRGVQPGGWLKATFYFSVNQDSKYKEESKKFIDWFINDPEVGEIAGTTRGVPIANKIVSQLQPKFNVGDKLTVEMINKTAVASQTFNPGAPGWSDFGKDEKDIKERLMFEKITPEQSYDELAKAGKKYEK